MEENLTPNNIDFRVVSESIQENKNNKSLKWLYITCTCIAISVAISLLLYIALETFQQTDRSIIIGAENHSEMSENIINYSNLLDDKRNGMDVESCIEKLETNKDEIDARRMITGFKTYELLQQYVSVNKKFHYEELQKKIEPFLKEVRSHYDISSDTLYFAYMARDIIFYIYTNDEVFLIHDDDRSIMGIDGRSLKAFSEDATSVYDYLKYILIDRLKEKESFFKDAYNANLFLITMYCKARKATTGVNDKKNIDSILRSFESNKFLITGQTKERLNWLKSDLEAVNTSFVRTKIEQNRPDFVSPIWLN